jgi:hypothetical protein
MRQHYWIVALSALLAPACATSAQHPAPTLGESRASVQLASYDSSDRDLRIAQYLAPARQPNDEPRELRAELEPEHARQQLLSDADPRISMEPDVPPTRADVEHLERQLAATEAQIAALATPATQLDDSMQGLRDREVALRAKIDVLYVQLDRAEHGAGSQPNR